jgi:hypothetical protein
MSSQEPPDLQFEALLDYLRLSRGYYYSGRTNERQGVVLMMEAEQDEKPL